MSETQPSNNFENCQPQVEKLSTLKVGDRVNNASYEVEITDATIQPFNPEYKGTAPVVLGKVSRSERFPINVGRIVKVAISVDDPEKFEFVFSEEDSISLEFKKLEPKKKVPYLLFDRISKPTERIDIEKFVSDFLSSMRSEGNDDAK